MKKPKPQEILIPRLYDTNEKMAESVSNLGYRYFVSAQGWIMQIHNTGTIEETMFGIDEYPLLQQLQKNPV